MTKRNLIILGILVVLVVLFIILFATRVPEPTSVSPLPTGEQIYDIIGSEQQKFRISRITIDPLDVAIGQTQTVTVVVEDLDKSDVAKENRVTATALTDNDSVVFSLKIAEITDKERALVVVWQGFWELQDTRELNYQLAVQAFKESASDLLTLTFK